MIQIDLYSEFNLAYLGEEWKDCYIRFTPINIIEAQELMKFKKEPDDDAILQKTINVLENKFISGKVLSKGQVVDLPKDELKLLPVELLTGCMESLSKGLDAKKKNQSTIPSEGSMESNQNQNS